MTISIYCYKIDQIKLDNDHIDYKVHTADYEGYTKEGVRTPILTLNVAVNGSYRTLGYKFKDYHAWFENRLDTSSNEDMELYSLYKDYLIRDDDENSISRLPCVYLIGIQDLDTFK